MDDEMITKIKLQHIDSYKNAVYENIKNNTSVLVDEDITSLLKKPPLDSMDFIKTKFLDLAKKNKMILNTEELSKILDNYRKYLLKCRNEIKDIRVINLISVVDKVEFNNNNDVIKINKKDFVNINKEVKKILKNQLNDGLNKCIIKNADHLFMNDVSSEDKEKIINDVSKYISGSYQKQLMENFDIKILVKDTTLMNCVKEQADRYLFTISNSRLLNDDNNVA